MVRSSLTIVDNRNNKEYEFPIYQNAIRGSQFASITEVDIPNWQAKDGASPGLKIFDEGLRNVAVVESSISFLYVLLGVAFGRAEQTYVIKKCCRGKASV